MILRPTNWPTWFPDPTPHDWVEDSSDEDNGQYGHVCRACDHTFVGHKRRPDLCRVCGTNPKTTL